MSRMHSRLQLLVPGGISSATFDLLRWVAAAYVVIFHLRPVLFQGETSMHHAGIAVKGLYAVTSLGYQFVMLFFVLSGYLIASSVLRSMSEGNWSWRVYLASRVTRLWLVLIPALAFSVIWARIEVAFFHNSAYFHANMTFPIFFGNLFFLQGVLVPDFSQNLPLWSLAYEFWYYILFPCVLLIIISKRWIVRVLYGLLVFCIGTLLGKNIMLYFLIWLLGAALAILPHRQLPRKLASYVLIPATLVLLVLTLIIGKIYQTKFHLANFDMVGGFPPNFLVALVFTGLLYILLHSFNSPAKQTWVTRASSTLANFSYTLYLTHYPIINLLRVWFGDGQWGTWTPDSLHLVEGVAILGAIFLYAYGVSRLTEAHTSTVRKMVMRILRFNPKRISSTAEYRVKQT